jgi:multidrug efflux pump subunit AcrB
VNHFGQLPAVTISFSLPPTIALSDAVNTLNAVQANLNLPAGIQGSFQGTAKAFQHRCRAWASCSRRDPRRLSRARHPL